MAEAVPPPAVPGPSRAGGLAIAAAIVAFGFIGSRLLGVVRTTAISYAFGSGGDVSAYFVAFRIPDLIFQVLSGAALGAAFIPVFARVFKQEGGDPAWRLASNVLNLIAVATLGLCVIAFALAPWLVPLTAPGLSDGSENGEDLVGKAVLLTRIMLISPFLFSISGIVMGILNAREKFLLTAIAPMLYNLSIIAGAVFLSGPFGIEGLAIGVVIGSGLHLAIQVPGLAREGMRYRPSFEWRDAAVREVARLTGPRIIGLGAASLNFVIATYFASKIGDRSIPNLTYAFLLASFPLALFGMAISTAVFPRLASQAADDDLDALDATVSRALRAIMFLTVPAALGLALLAEPVTRVLLEWGEYTSADARVTGAALTVYAFGVIAQAGVEIHSRGFYALSDTRTPVTFAVVAMLANLILAASLYQPLEEEGVALALVIASWVEWVLLYAIYIHRMGGNPARDLASLARIALSAAVMTVAVALIAGHNPEGKLEALIVLLGGTATGVVVYGIACHLLRVPELDEARERVLELLGRAPSPPEA